MTDQTEGLWYVVRFRKGWRLVSVNVTSTSDFGHEWFWESCVAPQLGAEWNKPVWNVRRLRGCVYSFPRGRVVRVGQGHVVYHGGDFEFFVSRSEILRVFNLSSRTRFRLDQHERCLNFDKEAVRAILRIKEDWSAAPLDDEVEPIAKVDRRKLAVVGRFACERHFSGR